MIGGKFFRRIDMIILNTQGVVLRTIKFNDNDLILTIFSRKYGKASVLAKGAQRQRSRFLSVSQIFSYNNYVLKKQKDMFTLSQGESIKSFYNISQDLESYAYTSFIAKLVENNIVEGQTNNRLFELFVKTLFLFSEQVEDRMFLLDIFLLKFIDYMGYRPDLNNCVSCGKKFPSNSYFSLEKGGVICGNCSDFEKNFVKLDKTTIELMQYILNNDIIDCNKAKVSPILVKELFFLLKRYLVAHFENVNFLPLDLLK